MNTATSAVGQKLSTLTKKLAGALDARYMYSLKEDRLLDTPVMIGLSTSPLSADERKDFITDVRKALLDSGT